MSSQSCGMRAADRVVERILVMRVMCVLCHTFMELNLKPFMDVYFYLRDALSSKQMAYCLVFKHDLQVEVYFFLWKPVFITHAEIFKIITRYFCLWQHAW
jgi:hypothetical protein